MEDLCDIAIKATRDYLVHLLVNEKFCKARQVGASLETLVNVGRDGENQAEDPGPPTPGSGARIR